MGRVLSVDEATEYAYKTKNPSLRCVLWERNIGYSLRPGFADGFFFPYQDAVILTKQEGIDPEVAFAPDDHFDSYCCGSELLTHDGAVASLVAFAPPHPRVHRGSVGPGPCLD